jgi:SPP1 family predicted phage head-tail adaptor
MRAGTLDRPIKIQRREDARDSAGQPVEAWTTIFEPFARVEFMGGSDGFKADQTAATQKVKFTIRFRRGVLPEHRVLYNDHPYRIEDIAEIRRRDEMELTCAAIQAPGGRS